MTPEEKTQVLGTIEKLANQLLFDFRSSHGYVSGSKMFSDYMSRQHPCVSFVWVGDIQQVSVTDFIQREV